MYQSQAPEAGYMQAQPQYAAPPAGTGYVVQQQYGAPQYGAQQYGAPQYGAAQPPMVSAAGGGPVYVQPMTQMPQMAMQPPQQVVAPMSAVATAPTGMAPTSVQPLGASSGYDPTAWRSRGASPMEVPSSELSQAPTVAPSSGEGFCNSLHSGELRFTFWATFFLLVSIAIIPFNTGIGLVVFAIVYLIYLVEVFKSDAYMYLANVIDMQHANHDLDTLRTRAPSFWWMIQNYHIRVTHSTRRRNGRSHRTTHRRRVNTHKAQGSFVYNSFRDVSPLYPDFTKYYLTRAKFGVNVEFGDQFTAAEFQRQKNYFFSVNTTDQKSERKEGVALDGLIQNALIESEPSKRPMCLSQQWFVLCSLLCCSCCYRVWVGGRTGKVQYNLLKQVFTVPSHVQLTQVVVRPVTYMQPVCAPPAQGVMLRAAPASAPVIR